MKGTSKNYRIGWLDEFYPDSACKGRRLHRWQSRFLQAEDGFLKDLLRIEIRRPPVMKAFRGALKCISKRLSVFPSLLRFGDMKIKNRRFRSGIRLKTNTCGFEYWVLVIILRLLLDWAYDEVIAPHFYYTAYKYHPSEEFMLASWVILIALAGVNRFFFKNKGSRMSFEILYVLFILHVVPFTSMVGAGHFEVAFVTANTVFWLLLFCICACYPEKKRARKLRLVPIRLIREKQIKIIAIVFGVVILYISARYAHFRFNLSLDDVYAQRSEAAAYNMPSVLVYLFSWTRPVNTVLIAYFIRKKMKLYAAVTIVIQLLSFSIDGLKTTLFLLCFALAINMLPKVKYRVMNGIILTGISCVNLLSMLFYKLTGNIYAVSLLCRRVFFEPVKISGYYFDFFTKNQPDYFRQSFLRLLGFKSPYPTIPVMISEVYENNSSFSNNGLISDAITNMGYIGILVFPLVLFLILRFIDRSSKGLDSRICITIAMYLAIVLTNSFLMRVLFTHGLIVLMLVLKNMTRDTEPDRAKIGLYQRV